MVRSGRASSSPGFRSSTCRTTLDDRKWLVISSISMHTWVAPHRFSRRWQIRKNDRDHKRVRSVRHTAGFRVKTRVFRERYALESPGNFSRPFLQFASSASTRKHPCATCIASALLTLQALTSITHHPNGRCMSYDRICPVFCLNRNILATSSAG